MRDIQYPEAYEKPYRRVHVSALTRDKRGGPHYCYGCDGEMVARLGDVNTHHFAHKPPWIEKCNPDNALHRAAQANILEGFADAAENGKSYLAGFPCMSKGCPNAVEVDIATAGATIVAERGVVQGTRADLVVYGASWIGNMRVPLVIEVVVTHDLEKATLERYEDAKIPVIKVKPHWDDLESLRHAVIGYDTVNVPPTECEVCESITTQEEARKLQEESARQTVLREYERGQEDARKLREDPAYQVVLRKYERAQEEARKLRVAQTLREEEKRIEAEKLRQEEERVKAQKLREEEERIRGILQVPEGGPLLAKFHALLRAQQDGTIWRR